MAENNIVDMLERSRERQWRMGVAQAADENPQDAARALELSQDTALKPEVTYENLEQIERQQKALASQQLVQFDKYLQDYVNSHPLAAKVSANDWGNLSAISEGLKKFWARGAPRTPLEQGLADVGEQAQPGIVGEHAGTILHEALQGAKTGFGDGPPGSWTTKPDWSEPEMQRAAHGALAIWGLPFEIPLRFMGAGMGALAGGGVEALHQIFGVDRSPDDVERMLNAAVGLVGIHPFAEGTRAAVGGVAPETIAAAQRAGRTMRHVDRWMEANIPPPIGADELTDQAHAVQAQIDAENSATDLKNIQKSETREMNPDFFYNQFMKGRPDANIGIPLEKVKELYGSKLPEPDDKILGFIPGIKEQLAGSDEPGHSGYDIEVPRGLFLSKVDPEIEKQIHDFIRWRPGGMNLEEASKVKPADVGPEKFSEAGPEVDALRRVIGQEPLDDIAKDEIVRMTPAEKRGLDFRNMIPKDAQPGSFLYRSLARGVPEEEHQSLASFPLRDILPKLYRDDLPEPVRVLSEFFGKDLEHKVGDVMVHVIDPLKMDMIKGRGNSAQGYYHTYYNHIVLRRDFVDGSHPSFIGTQLVMHEAAHAVTMNAMLKFRPLYDYAEKLMKETKKYIELTPEGKILTAGKWSNMFKDPYEFVVEAQSDDEFMSALHNIPLSPSSQKGLRISKNTMWEQVRGLIKELWTKTFGRVPTESVMDAIFRLNQAVEDVNERLRAQEAGEPVEALKEEAEKPKKGEQLELPQEGTTRVEDRRLFGKQALGITQTHYRNLVKNAVAQLSEDKQFAADRMAKLEKARQQDEWKDTVDELTPDIEDSIRSQRAFLADEYYRTGQFGDTKIRRRGLGERFLSPEQKASLNPAHLSKLGEDPAQLAEVLGYRNANDMIGDIARLEKARRDEGLTPTAYFNKLVQAEAERRTRIQLGRARDEISDAEDHVLGPTQMELIHDRILGFAEKANKLARDGKGVTDEKGLTITKEMMVENAKRDFNGLRYGNVSAVKQMELVGNLQKKANELAAAGKWDDAFKQQQNAFHEFLLAREAKKFAKEEKSALGLIKRYRKYTVTNVPQETSKFIKQFLYRAGFKIGMTAEDLGRIINHPEHEFSDLQSYLNDLNTVGPVVQVDPIILDPSWSVKDPKDMTIDQFRAVAYATKTLDKIAREANKTNVLGEGRDLNAHAEKMVDKIDSPETALPLRKTKGATLAPMERLAEGLKTILYKIRWVESFMRRIDLWDPYGIWTRSVTYTATNAANEFSAINREYAQRWKELPKLSYALRNRKLPDLFLDPTSISKDNPNGDYFQMRGTNLIQIMRYAGTESGLDKLTNGRADKNQGYRPKNIDPLTFKGMVIQYINKHATEAEWNFIRKEAKIWEDLFKLSDMKIAQMGYDLPKKEPLRTYIHPTEGPIDGWYHPIIWDNYREGTSKTLKGDFVDPKISLKRGAGYYVGASTPQGHLVSRTGYIAPLYLGMDRSVQRMNDVIKDIAFRGPVYEINKIIKHSGVRNAIMRHYGKPLRDLLDNYVNVLAGTEERSHGWDSLDATLNFLRSNIISQLIGGNIRTFIKHTASGAINSIGEVGARRIAQEMAIMFNSGDLHPTKSNWAWAMDSMPELPRRFQHYHETLGGAYEGVTDPGRFGRGREAMISAGSWPIAYGDLFWSVGTALAKFKDSLEELVTKDPSKPPEEHIGLALDAAQQAVRITHGSTSIATRPRAMRGGPLARTFTSLYGFFNTIFQRNYEAIARSKVAANYMSEGEARKAIEQIPKIVTLLMTGYVMPVIIEELVTPYTNEERESWGKWAAKAMLLGATQTIPVMREFGQAVANGYDTTLGMLDTGMREVRDTWRDLGRGTHAFDSQHGGKTIKHLNATFGTATGYSYGLIGNILKTIWDSVHRTSATPRSPIEVFNDMTTGNPTIGPIGVFPGTKRKVK